MLSLEQIVFVILALAAVATSLMTITRKKPVPAAMWMVGHFATLGGLYLTLQAQFIAVIQVLVYAGAIMVLVLFVIMLLNMTTFAPATKKPVWRTTIIVGSLSALVLEIWAMIWRGTQNAPQSLSPNALAIGSVENMGHVIYTQYGFPFEAVSFVLLAAVVGAVMLAKKNV